MASVDLMFYAHFVASKTGKTGLTVTIDIDRYTRSDGTRSEIVTGGSMTEGRRGWYSYRLASADPTLYDYGATAITADSTVDQQHTPALWTRFGVEASITDGAITAATIATGAIDADALAADAITAAKIATDAITSDELAASATSEIAAAVWAATTRTLSSFGTLVADTAAAVWAYATRTLTNASATSSSGSASQLQYYRGDSWAIDVTGLPDNTGYTSIWFTIKDDTSDTDAQAVLQIKKNSSGTGDGLLYINGEAATVAQSALASITVLSTTSIRIAVDESITSLLPAGTNYHQDIQTLIGGNINTPSIGRIDIIDDVTRSVT